MKELLNNQVSVAYFSMEIGVNPDIPTYSGGLGILAGDTIRSAADLKVPVVAVTLLYRKGYFFQKLDTSGWQQEEPVEWIPDDYLEKMPARASVNIEGRKIILCAWKYEMIGAGGFKVPVYFLDTDLPENSEWDRHIIDYLYGGDPHYRLCQEVILGIGGIRMLQELGYVNLERYHMNEGHAALLGLELLDVEAAKHKRSHITKDDIEPVRKKCVFTTHTPVPAGHDQFPMELVKQVLGPREEFDNLKEVFCHGNLLNMTYLALNLSHFINGVAKKHGEISKHMFAKYRVEYITNGVHVNTWLSNSFKELLNDYIPGWETDNFALRYALNIPRDSIWNAHQKAKEQLIDYVNHETNDGLGLNIFTIGFARRATTYKRADLIFTDLNLLKSIAAKAGSFQLVFAGKAHPNDQQGKEIIKHIIQIKNELKDFVKVIFLENYDMELGGLITSGVDLWLNTPHPPMEASGTSGMKAALNGVPSLSILDGWWIEGCIEGITGWAIGDKENTNEDSFNNTGDALQLYDKMEKQILPLFYNQRDRWIDVMRHAIAMNGSFFNTQRMLQQYVLKAYFN
ncbi:MAG TPA: alpha-glucan family phosphorylase [Ignavibacteria bacterium]|nr:alpha-glucan family phosphorylase [Ignavibacteria bacterium]